MTDIKNMLPIGSVVLLKGGEKRLMIIGIVQSDSNRKREVYDYLGVMYPEGHIGDGFQYLFNQEDIEQIFFRGYEDEERAEFLDGLSATLMR